MNLSYVNFIIVLAFAFKLVHSCGINSARIINGEVAPDNYWPWIVSLQMYTDQNRTSRYHFCAGSLITSQYILTAAHCFDNPKNYSSIVVKIGSNYVSELNESLYEISQVYNNAFDSKKIINDISIVKLKENVTLSDKVSTICLPNGKDVNLIIDQDVYVAGW